MPNTDPINIPIKATDKATSELRKVAQEADKVSKKPVTVDVKAAGGGPVSGLFGKVSGAFQNMSAKMAGTAAAAVTAAKFIGESVGAFQSLALEAGRFADATGLSVEEASKFIEVAGDLGVSAEQAEGMIGKFNKTVGNSPEVLQKYGVELVKAKDGTTDVQATFLNAVAAVQSIKDPTDRAAAAAELFGKSWQGAAELVMTDVDDLKASFDDVSDAKIINDEELEKAKTARAGFDRLQDAIDDLKITVGQELAPALADLAVKMAAVAEQGAPLAKGLGLVVDSATGQWDIVTAGVRGLGKAYSDATGFVKGHLGTMDELIDKATAEQQALEASKEDTDSLGDAFDILRDRQQDAAGAAEAHAAALDLVREAAKKGAEQNDKLRKSLSMKKESQDLIASVGGAMLTIGSGAKVASDDVYRIQQSIIDVGEYAGANPIEIQNTVEAANRGDWNAVASTVQGWANQNPVEMQIRFQVAQNIIDLARGAVRQAGGTVVGSSAPAPAAAGAVVSAPAPVAVPATMAVPTANVKVTVNAGMIADTTALTRALTRSNRATTRLLGPRWRELAA